ncbi:MAG: AI-2E family transporter, partial [Polaromonas sp.]
MTPDPQATAPAAPKDQGASAAIAEVAIAVASAAGKKAETDAESPSSPMPILLHMPVNIRSLSLVVLAVFAGIFVLRWAQAVFIPFLLGLIFSYALSPIVNVMESRRVPRWLGAAVLLLAIFGVVGTSAYSLSDEAVKLVNSLPAAAQKFRQTMQARRVKSGSTLDTVQKAAAQIEQAAQESGSSVAKTGALRVVVETARFNIKDYLWTGTLGLAALVGQITVVVFLTYFLMVSGDTFRRKLIKLAGPSLSSKKITLQALDEITGQIQRYLQVQ